jgi:hypothetical protein
MMQIYLEIFSVTDFTNLHKFLKIIGLTQNGLKTTKYGVSQACKTAYVGCFA